VTYALVVGSNRPGPGQQALRFALDDAGRVAEVLTEAGGATTEHLVRLDDPDAATLVSTLDGFEARLAADALRGQATVFLFYYSGHARAQGLDLGAENVSLADLRSHLEALDATVTLAVLDACQSGAVTDAKGVLPAADFSTSSVSGLGTAGFAVIASSSDTELSQESAALGGGIFTHHLATGLRGAADANEDGRVSLDEAYTYAYDRTLVTSSATAIGAQHVTLETDLKGQGQMILTRPEAASARLHLPAELAAEVLLTRAPHDTVMAEVHKAPGAAMELALAPGSYQARVRQGQRTVACPVALVSGSTVALDPSDCPRVSTPTVAARGGSPSMDPTRYETLFVELGLGLLQPRHDAYVQTLEDFGFAPGVDWFGGDLAPDLSLVFTRYRWLSAVGTYGKLDDSAFHRAVTNADLPDDGSDLDHHFRWLGTRLGLSVRGQLPLAHGALVPYLQLGGGLAFAKTTYQTVDATDVQHFVGPQLSGAAGLQLVPGGRRWRHLGIFWQSELIYAPVISNLLGERHDSGGVLNQLGLRGGF